MSARYFDDEKKPAKFVEPNMDVSTFSIRTSNGPKKYVVLDYTTFSQYLSDVEALLDTVDELHGRQTKSANN